MDDEITVVLADHDVERRIELKKTLFKNPDIETSGEVQDEDECASVVEDTQPELLILSIPFGEADAVELVGTVSVQSPQTEIILIAEEMEDRDDARKLMRHGARDYIVRPVDEDELLQVVDEVVSLSRKRKDKLSQIMTGRASGQTTRTGKILTVFSTKGGVGRSLFAVNLACMFRELTEKRVCLVDFDLQFGDDAILLDMTPTTSISSLARDAKEVESVDHELLDIYTHTHEESGIDLLPAPPRPEEADYVGDSEARKILEGVKRHYEYIVIDTSSQVTEPVIAALENSDLILLLLTLELPTIKNGKLMLELMESLGLEQDRVRIVMNRDMPGSEVQLKEVEDALDQDIIGGLPSDGEVVMPSIDEGIPVVLREPNSDFSTRLADLARTIIVDEFELEDELLEGEETAVQADSAESPFEDVIASPGSRMVSGLIDHAIGFGGWAIFAGLGGILGTTLPAPTGILLGVILGLIGLFIPLGYLTYFHSSSRSVGTRLANCRVVDELGEPPGVGTALTRSIVELILPGISHFIMFLSPNSQGLHDMLTGTYVITTESSGET